MTIIIRTIILKSQTVEGDEREIRFVEMDPKWQERSDHGGEPCHMCGREVGEANLYVGTIDGSEAVRAEDANWLEANSLDYLGYYRVGSGCAKLLPPGFVTGYPFKGEGN